MARPPAAGFDEGRIRGRGLWILFFQAEDGIRCATVTGVQTCALPICLVALGVAWLNTECDKACVDVNEWGWLCGWVMECQEKGYITREQLGFELKWGDIKGAHKLLQMVSRREGFGNILAEGVKRAAEKLGGPAKECAIYIEKGATPRGH